MKILISGLFGVANFGDELFSKVISEELKDRGYDDLFVFTYDDSITKKNVTGKYTVFPAFSFYSSTILKNIRTMRKIDLTLIGGGGLFNQVFFFQTIPNYSAPALLALLFGKQYAIHGIEIGSIKSPFLKSLTQFVFKNASYVMYRDQKSFDRALAKTENHFIGKDLSHSFLNRYFGKSRISIENGLLVINLQHALKYKEEEVLGLIDQLKDRVGSIKIVVVSKEEAVDATVFASKIAFSSAISVDYFEDIDTNLSVLASADILITEKFHFTLAGFHSQKEQYVISRTTKVREFVKDCQLNAESGVEQLAEGIYLFKPSESARSGYSAKLASDTMSYFDSIPASVQKKRKNSLGIKTRALLFLLQSFVLCIYHRAKSTGPYEIEPETL